MKKVIRPMFITPLVCTDKDVNGVINTALIEALPENFNPVILGSDKYEYNGNLNQLKVHEFYTVRALCKYGPQCIRKRLLNCPDAHYFTWFLNAMRISKSYIAHHEISYFHSISVPYSSHLVALKLKMQFGLPWVAQFYEPWVDNPFRRPGINGHKKEIEWERRIAQEADLIIHNSEEMCDSWKKRYGKIVEKKLFTLPMSFCFGQTKDFISPKMDNKLRFSHIGNLYGLRSAKAFLKSLAYLLSEHPEFKEKIELMLIGKVSDSDINLINELHLTGVVKLLGRLSEEECVKYYQQTDIFLVIESADQGLLFFPSKLIRYYYYQKPIIGLTLENSVLYNQLKQNGHNAFTPYDIEGIKYYIMRALSSYDSLLGFNREAYCCYEAKRVAEQYASIIFNRLYCR